MPDPSPAHPAAPSLVVVADLTVDLAAPRARRGERRIRLSPREHAILRTLATHPGRPVTRDALLAAIGEDASEVATNLVDVTIHYLRVKVDKAHRKHLIHTIRGEGYALADWAPPEPPRLPDRGTDGYPPEAAAAEEGTTRGGSQATGRHQRKAAV
jgi:DNA-binding response OmpR family regulator